MKKNFWLKKYDEKLKKSLNGPKYWSYEKVEENGPKIFLMVLGGSAFYVSAIVWPKMSKMLMCESGTTGDSVQVYRELVLMNLSQH